jgi:hypothetical protein
MIVNISGKQRMFSQKITKLAIYYELSKDTFFSNTTYLKEIIDQFSKSHKNLKKNYLKQYDNIILEDLYNKLEPHYLGIVNSSNSLINNPNDREESTNFLTSIKQNEAEYLHIMDKIVLEYQKIGEKRLKFIKNREFTFNVIVAAILLYILFFVLIPFKEAKFRKK